MTETAPKIRLFLDAPLSQGVEAPLNRDQAHYLFGVIRLKVGDSRLAFNGRSDGWRAEAPIVVALARDQLDARSAGKAGEMGCGGLRPGFIRRPNSRKVDAGRLRVRAIEIAGQCGPLSEPEVAEPVKPSALLDIWPADRRIMFRVESGAAARARGSAAWRSALGDRW